VETFVASAAASVGTGMRARGVVAMSGSVRVDGCLDTHQVVAGQQAGPFTPADRNRRKSGWRAEGDLGVVGLESIEGR
jgi:hypothetical protein